MVRKMTRKIYNREEFMEKTGITGDQLDRFLKGQILKPAGRVDGTSPYFDDAGIEAADAISKLLAIGYSMDDVIRIRRKVGLPKSTGKGSRKDEPLLTVGELAARIGSNARTIKHWEEKGIIEPSSHTPGGHRLYHEHFAEICTLLVDLQNIGYTLDEIKVIADLTRDFMALQKDLGVLPAGRAGEKLAEMKEQMNLLDAKMKALEKGIGRWRRILKQHRKEVQSLSARLEKGSKKSKSEKKETSPDPTPGEEGEPVPA
jgi:DNA-binding transcriptional MerR regulator